MQLASEPKQRWSTSLAIREKCRLKTQEDNTMYSFELKWKRLMIPIVGEDVKQLELPSAGGNIK